MVLSHSSTSCFSLCDRKYTLYIQTANQRGRLCLTHTQHVKSDDSQSVNTHIYTEEPDKRLLFWKLWWRLQIRQMFFRVEFKVEVKSSRLEAKERCWICVCQMSWMEHSVKRGSLQRRLQVDKDKGMEDNSLYSGRETGTSVCLTEPVFLMFQHTLLNIKSLRPPVATSCHTSNQTSLPLLLFQHRG